MLEKVCWSQQNIRRLSLAVEIMSVRIWRSRKAHLDCSAQPFTSVELQIFFDYQQLATTFLIHIHIFQFAESEFTTSVFEHSVYRHCTRQSASEKMLALH